MKQIIIRKTITLIAISFFFTTIYYYLITKKGFNTFFSYTYPFFFFTMFYFMIAWFYYLRLDGFNFFNSNLANRFFTHKNPTQTEKRFKLPSGLNYYADPIESDFLDQNTKEKARMYSYIIAAIICLIISFF